MSGSSEGLRRKIDGATDLSSVVHTMKALAASGIGQYEKAVISLQDYYRTIELGLLACLRQQSFVSVKEKGKKVAAGTISVIVLGSDQGLIGQFNEVLCDFAVKTLEQLPGKKNTWAVGERIQTRLTEAGITAEEVFSVPNSVHTIASLVRQILIQAETKRSKKEVPPLYVFHNRLVTGASYEPVCQKLLPLDAAWQLGLTKLKWPAKNLPEILGDAEETFQALIREYLFVSMFRACAESLASENASRLSAMQRAEKNIEALLEDLNQTFNRQRQNSIDEELFDVISGFEAMTKKQ
jgi:F-type H+-transporting ATPase subunit gamma